jgi:hypothetical protein
MKQSDILLNRAERLRREARAELGGRRQVTAWLYAQPQ